MIGDLKPYPTMKDSGLPWLGQVPAHWDLAPNRTLIRRRKALVGARHSEYTLLSLTKQGVIVRDLESGKGKFSADMGTCQEVRSGDLVFCLFDVPETPRTVGLSRHDGMITGAYTVFECSDSVSSGYFELFYRAMDDGKLLSPLYSGLRNTIPPSRFLGTKTPIPPRHEQLAIVRYLEHMDRRIRRYVRAKRKLIELLEEQKLEIIRRAVIRGVTTDVRRRPSGSEWIGDVPVHWNVLRSKYLFREVDQRSTTGEELRLSMSQKLGLVSSSLIEERRLVSESHVGAKICEPGDLVLNRLKAHLGVFALASERGLVSPDYTIFRPRTRLNGRYFEALYKTPACRVELRRRAKGIVEGFWRLYTDDFYDIRVPVPPLSEQTEIVASIRRDVAPTETAIIRTYRELSLLQEYRDRLIADVATGKLDVREAATKLPDEISQEELNLHELEPLFDDDLEDSDSCLDAALEEVEA